jgi:hypothetical protein
MVLPGVFVGVELSPALNGINSRVNLAFPQALTGRALIAHCLESALFHDLKRYTFLETVRADRGAWVI